MRRAFSQKRTRPQPVRRRLTLEPLEPRKLLSADSVVVFNEIMYHPADDPAGDDSNMEWIELHNQMAVNIDLSGWRLDGAVDFTFAEGTIIPGGGYTVVAASPETLQQKMGFADAIGPFAGRLDNGGERIVLYNNNDRLMDEMRYDDDDPWPVAPDGFGPSLAKVDPDSPSGPAENWAASRRIGGTPGVANFPEKLTPIGTTTVIDLQTEWKVDASGTDLGTAWREPQFDDGGWDTIAPAKPSMLITEIGTGSPDYIEIQNVSNAAVDTTGWFVVANDAHDVNLWHETIWQLPSDPVAAGEILYRDDLGSDAEHFGDGIYWPSTGSGWVMMVDNLGRVVDFVAWGYDSQQIADIALDIGPSENITIDYAWIGDPVAAAEPGDLSLQRTGEIDHNDATDWEFVPTRSPRVGNDGLVLPIESTTVGVELLSTQTTNYFRTEFDSSAAAGQTELRLTLAVDDGAVLYLNGEEIYRQNMPTGPIDHNTPAASDVGTASPVGGIDLPVGSLRRGVNVLAMEVHQAVAQRADTYFAAQLTQTVWPSEWQMVNTLLAWNEVSAAGPSALQCELVNYGTRPLEIGGYVIATSGGAEYVLPAEQLPPGGFRSLNAGELGFNASPCEALLIYSPDRGTVVDAVRLDATSHGRRPDGSGQWLRPDVPTFGEPNHFALHDEIVINEIMYHHRPELEPYAENDEEWIELLNRGTAPADLGGWRLEDAVEHTFASDTIIAPGEFVVVAKDAAALASKYPTIRIVGQFSGSLSNQGERIVLVDPMGNPADEVRYYDGKPWPEPADGGGSSLELRDPDADNSKAEVWAASDETDGVSWETYTYRGIAQPSAVGPDGQWHEFILGLLEAGEVLLDDIRVTENPGGTAAELIQNGSFESDTEGALPAKWRVLGTHGSHGQTRVIVDPDDPNNHVLHLVATGPTEHMHNHAETTLANRRTVVNGQEYEISFRAKWLTGSNQLNTRLYFNRLARKTLLNVPDQTGTPGRANSTREANIGPTFSGMIHQPVVPSAGEDISVSVTATDPDGVEKMMLHYAVDPTGPEDPGWMSVAMQPNVDGTYRATIPGQPSSTVIQFYVEGTDTDGATATFPAAGRDSRALIKVDDGRAVLDNVHNLRTIMTTADANFLHVPSNVMSNHHMGATVVYDEQQIFYDVGLRLRGNGRLSDTKVGHHVKFHEDELFRGIHKTVAIDRSGAQGLQDPYEMIIEHAINEAGGMPSSYSDIMHVNAPKQTHDAFMMLKMARTGDVFLDSQYDNGADGQVFMIELIYYPTTMVGGDPENPKVPEPRYVTGTDFRDLGDDREAYRWNFMIKNHRTADDYSKLMDFAKVMGLTGQAFAEALPKAMDVDQWMRVYAMASLAGLGDSYMMSPNAPHNLRIFIPPDDSGVLALPWDWDNAFWRGPTSPLWRDSNLAKAIALPQYKRLLYGHLHDIISTTFNPAYMADWTQHFAELARKNYSARLSYIGDRGAYVLRQLPGKVDFDITTGGGNAFSVDTAAVTLRGSGWINVREVRRTGSADPLQLTWTDIDNWEVDVPLVPGENPITLEAYDFQGERIDSESITVTSTLTERPVQEFLRIAEINYHPHDADTAAGELDVDDNEFEFVELLNTSTSETLDLTGVRLVQANVGGDNQGIRFDFAAQTLGPGERVVVVGNRLAFESRYGDAIPIAEGNDAGGVDGEFGGRLANGGEMLTLLDASGAIVQQFAYNDGMPWPSRADGSGSSLVVRNASGDFSDPGNWYASVERGGSPGTVGADPVAHIVARHIFYNNSAFDGNGPDANAADDAAIAPDKEALLPGAAATFANYTSYDRGINGIIVDIADPTGTPELADFAFRVGNSTDPQQWVVAPTPTELTVRPGEGTGNSDRVTIIWPDNAIRGQWLQVTVQPTANTGLSEPDVFYFGNAPAEAGDNPTNTIVNATDEIAARNFPHSVVDQSLIDDLYDYNRDRLVDATDQVIARANQTNPRTMLRMLTAPPADAALRQSAGKGQTTAAALSAALDWQYQFESTRSFGTKRKDIEATVDMLFAGDWD